jgi:hypothetical protein
LKFDIKERSHFGRFFDRLIIGIVKG